MSSARFAISGNGSGTFIPAECPGGHEIDWLAGAETITRWATAIADGGFQRLHRA